jgi:hypothetical protein
MTTEARLYPLFQSWRPLWSADDETVTKLKRLDELRERRERGNHCLPPTPPAAALARAGALARHIEAALAQPESVPDTQVLNWKHDLTPVLSAERWGRWLHLEHALEIASRTGDLLFCALLLRSMCEEVLRLEVLEYPNVPAHLKFTEDVDARRAWLSGALLAIAPCAGPIEGSTSPDEPPYFDDALGATADSMLKARARALNDYVHPNFGSHVLALFPQESAASSVLLDAVIDIYEAFLSMPWAAAECTLPGTPLPAPYIATPAKLLDRLADHVLPSISQVSGVPFDPSQTSLPELAQWLTGSLYDFQGMRGLLEEHDDLDNLADLLAADDVSKTSSGSVTSRILESASRDALPWRHPRTSFLVQLSEAREADLSLQKVAGHPKASSVGTPGWLERVARALSLAMTSTALKIDLLIAQTAYQVAACNQLGSVFCARSLLEHLAVIDWLTNRLEAQWDAISKRARDGTLSGYHLRSMDEHLARVLTGTKGSLENDRQWGPHWTTGTDGRSLNVFSIVEAYCADEPVLKRVYDTCSAKVHGRLMRGLEILEPSALDPYQLGNLLDGLVAATFACSEEVRIHAQQECDLLGKRLMHLADAVSDPDRARKLIPRITLSMERFKPGRDFTGTGDRTDPIRFAEGMPYHESFCRYCQEFGLDPARRRPDLLGDSSAWDIVEQDIEHEDNLVNLVHFMKRSPKD